ncbi:MAG: hypothetical protein PHT12_03005 [Patescibacteria group bacterium]|nr:hypothetical protein [Patescibacteria group bacterium]
MEHKRLPVFGNKRVPVTVPNGYGPYLYNPKTEGVARDGSKKPSGIICCIPHPNRCPGRCGDCFFQGDGKDEATRSYLSPNGDPLEDHLPNMPTLEQVGRQVVRVNDGGDSSDNQALVLARTAMFPLRFYNTSMVFGTNLADFGEPVVLTLNPSGMTYRRIHVVDPVPPNLMFVRLRVTTWNLHLVDQAVEHYTARGIPVVLTFMAFYTTKPVEAYADDYVWSQRTTNSYWVIKPEAWQRVMDRYRANSLVYSCGIRSNVHACSACGNCLREFWRTYRQLHG